MHIRMIRRQAFDTSALLQQLECPGIWNKNPERTSHSHSPHREVSDIWVRYFPREKFLSQEEGEIEWYPVAEQVGEAKRIASDLFSEFGMSLGGVLITRIPPGKQVYPHVDQGWHARHYEKFAVQVKGNERQKFHFRDESLITGNGDLFWFDNAFEHWVTNDSDEDRITLIVCIRRN